MAPANGAVYAEIENTGPGARQRRRAVARSPSCTAASSASAAGPSAFAGYQTPSAVSPVRYPAGNTTTPIKHLVVIFDENVSFDHYFGTCPS